MVNYRGPRLFRPLVDVLGTEIFNRITEIKSERYDLSQARFTQEDVKAMDSLERIVMTQKSVRTVEDTEVEHVAAKIPPCRQGDLRTDGSRIEADVVSTPLFLGCAD